MFIKLQKFPIYSIDISPLSPLCKLTDSFFQAKSVQLLANPRQRRLFSQMIKYRIVRNGCELEYRVAVAGIQYQNTLNDQPVRF